MTQHAISGCFLLRDSRVDKDGVHLLNFLSFKTCQDLYYVWTWVTMDITQGG